MFAAAGDVSDFANFRHSQYEHGNGPASAAFPVRCWRQLAREAPGPEAKKVQVPARRSPV